MFVFRFVPAAMCVYRPGIPLSPSVAHTISNSRSFIDDVGSKQTRNEKQNRKKVFVFSVARIAQWIIRVGQYISSSLPRRALRNIGNSKSERKEEKIIQILAAKCLLGSNACTRNNEISQWTRNGRRAFGQTFERKTECPYRRMLLVRVWTALALCVVYVCRDNSSSNVRPFRSDGIHRNALAQSTTRRFRIQLCNDILRSRTPSIPVLFPINSKSIALFSNAPEKNGDDDERSGDQHVNTSVLLIYRGNTSSSESFFIYKNPQSERKNARRAQEANSLCKYVTDEFRYKKLRLCRKLLS